MKTIRAHEAHNDDNAVETVINGNEDRKFKTYEETELECLNKLIEIVKEQK